MKARYFRGFWWYFTGKMAAITEITGILRIG